MRGRGEGGNPRGPVQPRAPTTRGKQVARRPPRWWPSDEHARWGGFSRERQSGATRLRHEPAARAPDPTGRFPGTMPGTPSMTAAPSGLALRHPMRSRSAVATPDSLAQPNHGTVLRREPGTGSRHQAERQGREEVCGPEIVFIRVSGDARPDPNEGQPQWQYRRHEPPRQDPSIAPSASPALGGQPPVTGGCSGQPPRLARDGLSPLRRPRAEGRRDRPQLLAPHTGNG